MAPENVPLSASRVAFGLQRASMCVSGLTVAVLWCRHLPSEDEEGEQEGLRGAQSPPVSRRTWSGVASLVFLGIEPREALLRALLSRALSGSARVGREEVQGKLAFVQSPHPRKFRVRPCDSPSANGTEMTNPCSE